MIRPPCSRFHPFVLHFNTAEEALYEPQNPFVYHFFIPVFNLGQMDERVSFYASTFGGTVFVTRNGDVVYSLPQSGGEDAREGVAKGVYMARNALL